MGREVKEVTIYKGHLEDEAMPNVMGIESHKFAKGTLEDLGGGNGTLTITRRDPKHNFDMTRWKDRGPSSSKMEYVSKFLRRFATQTRNWCQRRRKKSATATFAFVNYCPHMSRN